MQTRKCHADSDANANANADANRIRTKNNMSPSSSVGDIIPLVKLDATSQMLHLEVFLAYISESKHILSPKVS